MIKRLERNLISANSELDMLKTVSRSLVAHCQSLEKGIQVGNDSLGELGDELLELTDRTDVANTRQERMDSELREMRVLNSDLRVLIGSLQDKVEAPGLSESIEEKAPLKQHFGRTPREEPSYLRSKSDPRYDPKFDPFTPRKPSISHSEEEMGSELSVPARHPHNTKGPAAKDLPIFAGHEAVREGKRLREFFEHLSLTASA
jgi:hypothetical protein